MARAGSTGIGGVAAALALAAVAASPAAATPQTVEPLSVSRSISVPGGTTKTLVLTCPKASVALSGAATSLPARDSLPGDGPRRWTFHFAAQGATRNAGGVLRCVRLRLPSNIRGVGLVVGTMWSPTLDIGGHSATRLELKCSRDQVPTGWGYRRDSAPAADALAIVAALPTSRGFVFRVRNTGNVPTGATLYIRCLSRTQRATRGHRHSFSTRIATFQARAGGAQNHACRTSEFSLSTGFSLDPTANVFVTATYPAGERGGHWSFRGSGGSAKTALICLSRTTRFR